ncbi:hypothetical protein SARC_12876 [Sphaeroforma arctica JP610]|uniref:Uncharacterized protein n=1 Tax=Sphaeroforma arctica JP610 TaxID=667725 RepID=A0A0L0FDQ5_9EUKA|nr:hypothetical protein SARC_12876 [Sphaeroforma arctica JP610]KNC74581.1 hypothetical protein SARC_12876 [Sphaeroforma arctica JP610]|eukprot:XP_014148483.1 hypothetical protein SARC_12876 [Sphaeroforma arctica JP610]
MMKSGMASGVGDRMVEAHEPPFNLKNCGLILVCIVAVTHCGEFPQIITALEAFRLVGWQSTTEAMDILYTNLLAILVANKKWTTQDDELYETSEHGNYDRDYAVRKMLIILRNVEPEELKSSFCGCMRTCGSIMLAVKDKMAQVALGGNAFGQTIETYLTPYTRPMLIEMVDQDAKLAKWIPLFINVVAHSVGYASL